MKSLSVILNYFLNEEINGLENYIKTIRQMQKTNCCKKAEYLLKQIITDEKNHILMLKDLIDDYK